MFTRYLKLVILSGLLLFAIGTGEASEFDYERVFHLDAESLCETGMLDGYNAVLPDLGKFVQPKMMQEFEPDHNDDYYIEIGGSQYYLYNSSNPPATSFDCWAVASYTFFQVVNKQLKGSKQKLYAIYGGNDLSGVFMTEDEVVTYRKENTRREWPYIPTLDEPNYGFPGESDDFFFGLGGRAK